MAIVVCEIFQKPTPRIGHVSANPNFIYTMTGVAKAREWRESLLPYAIEGVKCQVVGSFKGLLFFIDRMTTYEIKKATIKELGGNAKKSVATNSISKLIIEPNSAKYPCMTYFDVQCAADYYYLTTKYKTLKPDQQSEAHPQLVSQERAPLEFTIPTKKWLNFKFINTEVEEPSDEFLVPSEFAITTPIATERGTPEQKLSPGLSKTVIVEVTPQPGRLGKSVELNPDAILNANNISMISRSASVSLNNTKYPGSFNIKLLDATHTIPVWFSKNQRKLFDIAITPEKKKKPSWFAARGGVEYIYMSGKSCSLSIGREKYSLDSTDHIELVGNLVMGLDFYGGGLPEMIVDGKIKSCKINGVEIIPTRWETVNPSVRGGLVGGIVGFVLSLIVNILSMRYRERRAT